MRHRGTVVTKAEIVRSVWDTNYDGDDNIVEVYIGYLRRKIGSSRSGHGIETVRGVGYRLARRLAVAERRNALPRCR